MKYIADLTLKGVIEVVADSKDEARKKLEDGYSMADVTIIDDEIDEINPESVRVH